MPVSGGHTRLFYNIQDFQSQELRAMPLITMLYLVGFQFSAFKNQDFLMNFDRHTVVANSNSKDFHIGPAKG